MIVLTKYYQSTEAVEKAEEPYKSVAIIIDKLFLAGPNGKEALSRRDFPVYLSLCCIQTIAEQLTNHPVTVYNKMLSYWDCLMNSNGIFTSDFYKYSVPYDKYRGTIFGGVYYVLTVQNVVEEEVLKSLDNLVQNNAQAYPYFKVFKDAADSVMAQQQVASEDVRQKDIVQSNLDAGDGKRIILSDRRGSDFTRIVQAMVEDGYFCHADKSDVTATEVGGMMLRFMGVTTEWKSMLQKAFDRDKPLKTFDQLRDAAQSYWQKRANIHD